MTHASSSARSRLDRFQCNQRVSEQLDREIRAALLEWKPNLSSHRAVLFSRRSPKRLLLQDRGLPKEVIEHPDFARRTALAFGVKRREEPAASRLRRLLLLKSAMKEVAEGIFKHGATQEAVTALEDRLGITMIFLRASEQGSLGEISICIE